MPLPRHAAHVPMRNEFLNYMMKPEVMAKGVELLYYANGNLASKPFSAKM